MIVIVCCGFDYVCLTMVCGSFAGWFVGVVIVFCLLVCCVVCLEAWWGGCVLLFYGCFKCLFEWFV